MADEEELSDEEMAAQWEAMAESGDDDEDGGAGDADTGGGGHR